MQVSGNGTVNIGPSYTSTRPVAPSGATPPAAPAAGTAPTGARNVSTTFSSQVGDCSVSWIGYGLVLPRPGGQAPPQAPAARTPPLAAALPGRVPAPPVTLSGPTFTFRGKPTTPRFGSQGPVQGQRRP